MARRKNILTLCKTTKGEFLEALNQVLSEYALINGYEVETSARILLNTSVYYIQVFKA